MKKAPERLRFAALAVDVPVFSIIDDALCVLVSNVHRPPHYVDVPGFLGGLIDATETADEAVTRVLKEKGSLDQVYTEQLYTFSDVNRDKRNRVVSVAYVALVRPEIAEVYTHTEAKFVPIKKIKTLAYDHGEVLKTAIARLQGKLAYTNIAQYVLPKQFTLTQLQTVYEVVLQKEFDKRNFRKKILAIGLVCDTGKMQQGVANRPAALYEFTSKKIEEINLF